MTIPLEPKIYHIVHIDRLPSILAEGGLVSDAEALRWNLPGTSIGDSSIKERRRHKKSHLYPDLTIGDCVPFYFCPRSVLLLSNRSGRRATIENRGGQAPIIHLESDLSETTAWADRNRRRWLFTDVNAAMTNANEYNELHHLAGLRWDVILSDSWEGQSHFKMAEFLVEAEFPWQLVRHVGVINRPMQQRVEELLRGREQPPTISIMPGWYY